MGRAVSINRCLPLLLIVFVMGLLRVGLLVGSSVHASGVLAVDGKGCPSIADHQRFVDEILNGNVDYSYPLTCIDLPRQTRVSDPIDTRLDRFGSEQTEFILVEVPGRGRYWTLASWVKPMAAGSAPPAAATPPAAAEAEPAPSETQSASLAIEPAPSEAKPVVPKAEPPPALAEPAPIEADPTPSEIESAALEVGPPLPEITAALGTSPLSARASQVWFAKELRKHFQDSVFIHGYDLPLNRIACLPKDITRFNFSAKGTVITFSVSGSLELSALPAPFKTIGTVPDSGYKLYLQAYLFSPTGRLVWTQEGVPHEEAPVSADGGTITFDLIDTYMGSLKGHELLVVATAREILPQASHIPLILGAKTMRLP